MREQHERLMDAHKLATSKMEALDRRRDDLGRELQDKERRVVSVEQSLRGMDGIQRTVDEVKREIGTLKALGDNVSQKTAALEAQRDAADRALAEADKLDRAMRQLDAGVRQQVENEKSLGRCRSRSPRCVRCTRPWSIVRTRSPSSSARPTSRPARPGRTSRP